MSRSVFGKASYIPNQKWVTILNGGSLYLLRSLKPHKVTGTFILPERLFAHPICDTEQHFKSFFVNKVKCPHRFYCSNVFKPQTVQTRRWADKNIHKLLRVIVFRTVINSLRNRWAGSHNLCFLFFTFFAECGLDFICRDRWGPKNERPADQTLGLKYKSAHWFWG